MPATRSLSRPTIDERYNHTATAALKAPAANARTMATLVGTLVVLDTK
jgi:hypothetical protein